MKRLRSCIARKSIRKHIFFTRRSHSGARPLSVGANDLAISSYVVSGSLFAVISDQRLMISVPQMTQDARRQVADEFGCCEYSVNFASVLISWGALSFPLADQRTKELTPHFVCVVIITFLYVHVPCTDKFSNFSGFEPVVGRRSLLTRRSTCS